MFTGIVQHVGAIGRIAATADGKRLAIDVGPLKERLAVGDSLAVNGACLTVAAIGADLLEFDVVSETLSRTTLGELRAGQKVNLEPSLRLDDALDGHLVQGHVDGVAELRRIDRSRGLLMEFEARRELTVQMVPKGSVTINGVSLTLAEAGDRSFAVALIPTTLQQTTLGELRVASKVNIETDVIGKYVLKYLGQLAGAAGQGGLTLDKLHQAGFADA
jgi:riboflavin synthase